MENNKEMAPLFQMSVDQNNEVVRKALGKKGKKLAIWVLIGGLFMLFGAIMSAGAIDVWVPLFFGAFFLFCLITAIVMICQGNYKKSKEGLVYKYLFFKDGLQVAKNTKRNPENFRIETACLYRSYKNKQYVAKVFEMNDGFIFKIYTGTYNFIPQYKEHALPKNVFSSAEQVATFSEIMKKIFVNDYIVK